MVAALGASSTDATSPLCGRAPSAMVLSPWGSRSMTSVRRPRSSAADARPRVIDVLPTPPLRLHTPSTSTCDTVSGRGLHDENRRPDTRAARPGGTAALVRTDWTHEHPTDPLGTRLHPTRPRRRPAGDRSGGLLGAAGSARRGLGRPH